MLADEPSSLSAARCVPVARLFPSRPCGFLRTRSGDALGRHDTHESTRLVVGRCGRAILLLKLTELAI